MSWQTRLKKPEFKKPEKISPDSKVVDMERAAEMDVSTNCCEMARTSAVAAIHSLVGHKHEKKMFPLGIEQASKDIEEMSCEELKRQVELLGKVAKYPSGIPNPPKGHKTNPLVIEFRKIYEEWKECEGK